MPRNKTLIVYNTSKSEADQEWRIYSEGVINQDFKIGNVRKTFTLSLVGNVAIEFGVDTSVYIKAIYDYDTDVWKFETKTPNEFSCSASQSSLTVSCSYEKS